MCPQIFEDNLRDSLEVNHNFFFGGITQLSRTAIGALTAGAVARETGLYSFTMALREYLYNQRTYAPNLGMTGISVVAGLGVSVLANSAINTLLVGFSVETGVIVGSLIDSAIQTYFIPEEACK